MNHSFRVESPLEAIIVGGSLAGLTAALAMARIGIRVTVLDRGVSRYVAGSGLWVDVDALHDTIGAAYRGPAGTALGVDVAGGRQYAVAWAQLHSWLRDLTRDVPRIQLRDGVIATTVGQDDQTAWVADTEGHRHTGDLIVGADGYRSITRRAVTGTASSSTFAGYVMWRGLLPERDPRQPQRQSRLPRMTWEASRGSIVFAYPVPGTRREISKGDRQAAWGWYDNQHNALFRAHGSITDTGVQHSLRGSELTSTELDSLVTEAARTWPRAWRSGVLAQMRARDFIGTPIAEYEPEALARGRVALIGDAAHLASPISGMGFNQSLRDIRTLAAALAPATTRSPLVTMALSEYEQLRLAAARALVRGGRLFSEEFGQSYMAAGSAA